MDAAERWLRKNDPKYAAEKAKNLRKKKEKSDYYKSIRSTDSPRQPYKKFPLK